jgi:phosphopantetheinyl transferase
MRSNNLEFGPLFQCASNRQSFVGANLVFAPGVQGDHQVRPCDLTPFGGESAAWNSGPGTYLASMPARLWPRRERGQGVPDLQGEKEFLAGLLVKQSLDGRFKNFTLGTTSLGQPRLLVDGRPGPPISFSWCAGRLFAVLGTPDNRIGLDAASPEEFTGAYPYERVFNPAEWQAALPLTGGDREEAAALLWSAKEAVVKALGCGYHYFGPRQVRLEFQGLEEHGPLWRGHLPAPAADQAPRAIQNIVPTASIRLPQVWLSLAWIPASAEIPAFSQEDNPPLLANEANYR